ncbi:MAG: hypothetical protein CMG35_03880 [Candidatus Marinimicrobia bacterium]|jgi:hypothetical protein|nr:hypothetical protein [Candidatus Neomarinimicrobiota bacterium]|tara:strand:+ start:443 stop:742 length:300 start_codon:yes stop_codon:yes gene_type:complete
MALLQTTVEKDDIITIRTVQGFEMVAKFVSESSASIKVNKPLMITGTSSVADTGVTKALFGPVASTMATLGDIEINSVNILCANETDSDIADQYKSQVS